MLDGTKRCIAIGMLFIDCCCKLCELRDPYCPLSDFSLHTQFPAPSETAENGLVEALSLDLGWARRLEGSRLCRPFLQARYAH